MRLHIVLRFRSLDWNLLERIMRRPLHATASGHASSPNGAKRSLANGLTCNNLMSAKLLCSPLQAQAIPRGFGHGGVDYRGADIRELAGQNQDRRAYR